MDKYTENAKKKRDTALKAGRRIMESEEAKNKIDKEHRIISLYIDNAKTYIQLATGALVFSISFMEKLISGKNGKIPMDLAIISSWVLWLLSIAFGVLYQYAAVKYIEIFENDHDFLVYDRKWKKWIPDVITDNPYIVYGLMMFCFFLGSAFFTLSAFIKLHSLNTH